MSDEIQRAGRVGPHRESHEPSLKGDLFIQGHTGFLEWDGASGIGEDWGMDDNDVLGCCGFAAVDHYGMAKTGQPSFVGLFFSPTFPSLGAAYCQYGRDQGEAPTNPPVPPATPDCADDGVDNATLMGWLYKNGFIDGYVEVPLDQLDWYAQTFKGIVLGLVIDGDECISDFQASPRIPWDAMGKSDGHDTLGIITHDDGSGALVTWGGVQPYTLAFRENNITDAWVILDKEDPFPDWDMLSAALTALHGTVGPDPYQTEGAS